MVDTESKMTPEDKQLIDDYLADMKFRELSPVTIRMTRYNLSKFAREVRIRDDNVIVLRHDLQQWLMRSSLQPQTRGLWITAIHCFYKWANAEGHFRRVEAPNGALVDFDPTVGLARPKSRKGTPHPIPENELSEALNMADPRMRCWLLIAAMCGARCKEVAGIRREDVHEDQHPMMLHLEFTKGSKPRDVPLPYDVLEAMQAYGLPESGFLWDVDAENVSREGNAFLHDLGIKSTMHKLRHRYGTNLYRASGADAFLTARLMGHSSTAVTQGYAEPDNAKATSDVVMDSLRIREVSE